MIFVTMSRRRDADAGVVGVGNCPGNRTRPVLSLVSVDGTALPPFDAGAHIRVVMPDGTDRPYSLVATKDAAEASAPSCHRIGVRREDAGGGGSRHMHSLAVGDTLWFISHERFRLAVDLKACPPDCRRHRRHPDREHGDRPQAQRGALSAALFQAGAREHSPFWANWDLPMATIWSFTMTMTTARLTWRR